MDLRFIKADASSFSIPLPPSPTMKSVSPALLVHRGRTWPSDTHTLRTGVWVGVTAAAAEVVRAAPGLIKSGGDRGRVGCLPAFLGAIFRSPAPPVAV